MTTATGKTAFTQRSIRGMFYERLESSPIMEQVLALAMLIPTDQKVEEYPMLGQVPGMREWLGSRQRATLRDDIFAIRNKEYESSIEFSRRDFLLDKTGQFEARIADVAEQGVLHWLELMNSLVNTGHTTVCYDGQFFFDTDHQWGDSGAQSNLVTFDISDNAWSGDPSTVANPSPEIFQQAIYRGIRQFFALKDDRGRPLNRGARSFQVMVPIHYMQAAQTAVSVPVFAQGRTNPLALNSNFDISVTVNPELENGGGEAFEASFAIFRTDAATKPFILQEEQAAEVTWFGPDSEYAKLNKQVLATIDCARGAGFGEWSKAVKVTLAA